MLFVLRIGVDGISSRQSFVVRGTLMSDSRPVARLRLAGNQNAVLVTA